MCEILPQYKDKLRKRAKRKFLNTPIIKNLAALNSPLHDKYITTLGCSSKIKNEDGKIISRYCKRPWCNICNPIRTAIRINNYREQLEALPGLTMTTLTAPNCKHDEIFSTIQFFRKVFRQFRNTYKKSTGNVFRGVYNFECTYNHRTRLYHPHIHIIHEGLPTEEIKIQYWCKKAKVQLEEKSTNSLIQYWLKHNDAATFLAQDTRPCTELIEGFKYQALSIFKIKINGKKQPFVPLLELDLIFQSLAGVRCFQPFGIRKVSKEEDEQFNELTAYETDKPAGCYSWKEHDWELNQARQFSHLNENGLPVYLENTPITLADYVPNKKTIALYVKLDKNEHYDKNPVPDKKGVRTVPKIEVPQSNSAALRDLSYSIRKTSHIETDQLRYFFDRRNKPLSNDATPLHGTS